jgi:hypothetical protein
MTPRAPVVVTLIDGTVVDDHSPLWLAECQQRQRHIESMRVRDRVARGEYLAGVERAEGLEAARRVAQAYVGDWQRRKDAADAALQATQAAQANRTGLA